MRTINAGALVTIQEEFGLEPVNIVRIYWSENYVDYSDKAVPDENIVGGLLELSGLEDVISLNGNSTSTNITIKLNDSEGYLKQIIDTHDIHKLRAVVYQWFADRPRSDAFILFDGQINTPIEWSEGERTLTLSIANIIENREFGFSFEEGAFAGIPSNLVGQAWPIVFGSVLKVPAIQMTESPTAILAEGFAVVYDDVYFAEMNALAFQMSECFRLAALWAAAATGASSQAARYIDGVDDSDNGPAGFNLTTFFGQPVQEGLNPRTGFGNPADDIDTYNSLMGAYTQAQQQSNNYMAEVINLGYKLSAIRADYNLKKEYAKSQVQISSANFPRGVPLIVEMGGSRFNVRVDGTTMNIGSELKPTDVLPGTVFVNQVQESEILNTYESQISQEKFKWIDGGTRIMVLNQPMWYLAALGAVTIRGVFGKTRGVTTLIPANNYQISYRSFTNEIGNTVTATLIVFNTPLTSARDISGQNIWEGDQVWCDIIGVTAGYWSNIISWTVENFTSITVDPSSFLSVAMATANQPMNFMYNSRVNTLTFVKELCFQARVSVWINDLKMYFRYLPAEPTPLETITVSDIVENTLVITCTDTESLYTKLVAEWKWSYDQPENNKAITRFNIEKYGLLENTYNYFAYNHTALVDKSLSFWAVRLGTSWKLIKFKTLLHKLKIEANDPITVTLDLVSLVPVTGIVNKATYDSASSQIDMEVWLPVRWGENTPYLFAYPAAVSDLFGKQSDIEAQTGSPFKDVQGGDFMFQATAAMTIQMSKHNPFARYINDFQPAPTNPASTSTALTSVTVRYDRPSGFENANQKTQVEVKTGFGFVLPEDPQGYGTLGLIKEFKSGQIYAATLLNTDKTVDVTQVQIHPDFRVPNGTVVNMVRNNRKWYCQSPVWVKAADAEEETP